MWICCRWILTEEATYRTASYSSLQLQQHLKGFEDLPKLVAKSLIQLAKAQRFVADKNGINHSSQAASTAGMH